MNKFKLNTLFENKTYNGNIIIKRSVQFGESKGKYLDICFPYGKEYFVIQYPFFESKKYKDQYVFTISRKQSKKEIYKANDYDEKILWIKEYRGKVVYSKDDKKTGIPKTITAQELKIDNLIISNSLEFVLVGKLRELFANCYVINKSSIRVK